MHVLDENIVQNRLARLAALKQEIGKVIVGQDAVIEELLVSCLAGGHCLVEGVPGLAKTLMVQTFARAVDLQFSRIQFTPDLMPSDVFGTEVLEEDHTTGKRFFKFIKGPVFTNVLLADEINRTPPKTQSALLEAMQERSITHGGKTWPLDPPFFVLATQNPIEQAGTYPLPEAQLDRFLLNIRVEYPSEGEEFSILARTTGTEAATPDSVLSGEELLEIQQLVRQVHISDPLMQWVNRLIRLSRPAEDGSSYIREWVRWGAGPRAGQALILTAKALALLDGRFSVTLPDLVRMAKPVLRHRILINFRGEAENVQSDDATETLLREVPAVESPLE